MEDAAPLAAARRPAAPIRPPHQRSTVLLAYAAFVLVGLGAGVGGVLLVAQLRDYGVDQATIGITFFTSSAGFVAASLITGSLIHRFGTRASLIVAGVVYVTAGLAVGVRPSFAAFVVLQALLGFATGLLESVLNTYLTVLPEATAKLNRLHAFFGVGALLGPLLATWMLTFTTWPRVWLVLAGVCVPLMVAILVAYPPKAADPTSAGSSPAPTAGPTQEDAGNAARGGLLGTAIRQPGVLLGTALLAVYVGLEIGLGTWGFSYLVDGHHVSDLIAGYTISGYWLGLTLGRFLIGPTAARFGVTPGGQLYVVMIGVAAAAAITWLIPVAVVVSGGFVLLGFFLGPIFPTTMALTPQLTQRRLVPTAIGVMNAGAIVGGALLPWLAGTVVQSIGPRTLLPYSLLIAAIQLLVWWRTATWIRRSRPAHDEKLM